MQNNIIEELDEILNSKDNHFITKNFFSWISEKHPVDDTFIKMTEWLNELSKNIKKIDVISVKENHINWKEEIGIDIFVDVVVRVWN